MIEHQVIYGSPIHVRMSYNYSGLTGTLMATPFVSGIVALIWNQNSSFSAAQVKARLEQTTFFDPSWGSGHSFRARF